MNRKQKQIPRHLIGGLALTNGVLLHTADTAVLAARQNDGSVSCHYWVLPDEKRAKPFLKLFGIRGLWLLWRTISWNSRVRQFVDLSAKNQDAEKGNDQVKKKIKSGPPSSLFPITGLIIFFLIYMDVLLLVETIVDYRNNNLMVAKSDGVAFILTAVLWIYLALRARVWDYMGYHGAGHQAIIAYENGHTDEKSVAEAWFYQVRCGAAVVSYVAIFLALIGFTWPDIAIIPSVIIAILLFSLSYEIVLVLDRYHDQYWAEFFSLPGVALQLMVARKPSKDQSEVAATALESLVKHSHELKSRQLLEEDLLLT